MGGAAAPERLKLHPLRVLRDALRVYREHWLGLMLGALCVFVPLSVLDAFLHAHEPESSTVLAVEEVIEQSLDLFGDVFYAGLVAAAVIAWRGGMRRERALDVARALPWGTIILLDLIVTFGTALLIIAFVIPGLVFYVHVALSPAVAKIEHVGVRAGLRRTIGMVRGNAWRVLGLLAVIEILSGAIEEALQRTFDLFAVHVAVSLVTDVVSAPIYGLATVLAAFALGARSHHQPGA